MLCNSDCRQYQASTSLSLKKRCGGRRWSKYICSLNYYGPIRVHTNCVYVCDTKKLKSYSTVELSLIFQ